MIYDDNDHGLKDVNASLMIISLPEESEVSNSTTETREESESKSFQAA